MTVALSFSSCAYRVGRRRRVVVAVAAAVVLGGALFGGGGGGSGDANAGEGVAPPFSAWLPATSLGVLEAADPEAKRALFDQTIFRGIVDSPLLRSYAAEFDAAHGQLAQRIAVEAGVDVALANELVDAPLALALLELDFKPEGGAPEPIFAARLQLKRSLAPDVFFEAVSKLVNQPANLKMAAELGYAVPSLTISENWATVGGDQGVLTILGPTPWRLAVRGPYVLVYRGKHPEPFKALLDQTFAPAGPQTLWSQPGFQAAWQGVGMRPGGFFLYLNLRRFQAGLAALTGSPGVTIWNALGLDSVQDMGISSGYAGEGVRDTLYFHAPGPRTGLLAALQSRPGAEQTVARLPSVGGGATAAHMDLAGFYEELPLLFDAVGEALGLEYLGKGGLTEFARQQTVLGVPVREVLEALGNDFAYIAGDDGGVLRFENADVARFGALIAQMNQREGATFREMTAGERFRVFYLSRTHQRGVWAMPSYCVLAMRDERRGALLLATHPQAIVALLTRTAQVEPFGNDPDFRRAMQGLGQGNDMVAYIDNRESLARVYTRLLPVLNWWNEPAAVVSGGAPTAAGEAAPRGSALPGLYLRANIPLIGADPGLLPPASALSASLFGFGVGIRSDARGITAMGYSPIGAWGGGVWLMDHLLLSNPTSMGVIAKALVDMDW